MVLGDVEETVTTVEVDEDTYEEIVRVSTTAKQPTQLVGGEMPLIVVVEDWLQGLVSFKRDRRGRKGLN